MSLGAYHMDQKTVAKFLGMDQKVSSTNVCWKAIVNTSLIWEQ